MDSNSNNSDSLATELSGILEDLSPSTILVERADHSYHPTTDNSEDDRLPYHSRETIDNDEIAKATTATELCSTKTTMHKRSRSDTDILEEREEALDGAGLRLKSKNNVSMTGTHSSAALNTTTGVTFADLDSSLPPTVGGPSSNPHNDSRNFDWSAGTKRRSTMTTVSSGSLAAVDAQTPAAVTAVRGRVYRSSIASDKLTTRDIAALDFLLGIPLEAEKSIVQHGWMLQQRRQETFQISADSEDAYGSDDEFEHSNREELLEPPTSFQNAKTTLALASNSHHGRWWKKWIPRESHGSLHKKHLPTDSADPSKRKHTESGELELPTASGLTDITHETLITDDVTLHTTHTIAATGKFPVKAVVTTDKPMPVAPVYAPGRRLEGDEALLIKIPLKIEAKTRQKSIARQAAIREWEIRVAHGLGDNSSTNAGNKGLLDGRMFLSAAGSYPIAVFSLKRYEPRREEAALRRQKLEARGGGGSHFVMPSRDWRGISFRALLPRKAEQARNQKAFNRFLRNNATAPKSLGKRRLKQKRSGSVDEDIDGPRSSDDDTDDESSVSSSSSEDTYIPGILDDPEMTLGRHRNVMIGDAATGCVVASTILFVKPALLKADLNAKFRDRFDGWEPSQAQRKYIGARVVDGIYTLADPTDEHAHEDKEVEPVPDGTKEINTSTASSNSANATPTIIRMPPSLTLSKIRSLKRQALLAFVRANLEIGTVALACVYFERLCLSCRVDKSNRRITFASCLLLASKINEPNEVLVMKDPEDTAESDDDEEERNTNKRKKIKRLQSSIRPSKRSTTMFASLLEFFTEDWNLSLKHLYAAEWGVFAALRFSLHATPSQVAFHFKRLMKTLEWNPARYLGTEMFEQWQIALATEEERSAARKKRREKRHVRKQRRLQRELQKEVIRGKQLSEKRKSTGSGSAKVKSPSKESLPFRDMSEEEITTAAVERSERSEHFNDSMHDSSRKSLPLRSSSFKSLVGRGKSPRSRTKSPRRGSPKKEVLGHNVSPTTAKVKVSSQPAIAKARMVSSVTAPATPTTPGAVRDKRRSRNLLSRFVVRRSASSDKLADQTSPPSRDSSPQQNGLPLSPSMPLFSLQGDEGNDQDEEMGQVSQTLQGGDVEDQSKSVAIDIPPEEQVEKDEDDGNESAQSNSEVGMQI